MLCRCSFRIVLAVLAVIVTAVSVPGSALRAQTAPATIALSVAVDASHATQNVLHVRERIAVTPGSLTLDYPKWVPGEHQPSGPIANMASLAITAGTTRLRWVRDLVDLNAIHVDVPPGVSSLDVAFDFLGAATGRYSSARLASANILVLTWHKVLLTPRADDYRTISITPSIKLPGADWQYATALDTTAHDGASVSFAPVTMEQLVDSPLDAGTNMRRWPLGSIDGAPVDIAAFADTADELDGDKVIPKLQNLVTQMGRLYRARHFNHYTFLLTLSDVLPTEGVEHHQSSDNGTEADFLTSADATTTEADLLAHEFNHSWDGKFRRPFDLATTNLRVPMQDELLWVYEGMTQFYGNLQATRSGLLTQQQYRDHLAATYAALDTTTGRMTTSLYDTAAEAPILYGSPQAGRTARRGTDFYPEGEMMWLEADATIRKLSGGRKSIDDFTRAFFGRTSTGPQVVTYTRDDVIAALEAVQHYDWRGFLATRIDAVAPHPPDPFTPTGWRLVYAPKPSPWQKVVDKVRKGFTARYSLGIIGGDRGMVNDVIDGSPAQKAGLSPGDTIEAVNDRETSKTRNLQDSLDTALAAAQHGGPPVRLLVLGGGMYRELTLPYDGGPRYPVLEPIPGARDLLDVISKPLGA
jgi:predicted metalloprotease with PDZ domain